LHEKRSKWIGFNREKELETVLRVKGYKSDSKIEMDSERAWEKDVWDKGRYNIM